MTIAAGSKRRAMAPPTPSLTSKAAMPASVRSVSAPAQDNRNSSAVWIAMSEKANSGSPPNTKRDSPAQPTSRPATASAWCSSALRRGPANNSDRPSSWKPKAVAGAMRGGGMPSTAGGIGPSDN